MFILVFTSHRPSRIGDELCAIAVHDKPSASSTIELNRSFIENSFRTRLSPKPGGAANPAGISMRGFHKRSIGMIGKHIRSPASRNIRIEPLDIGQPSAKDDDIRID